MKTRFVAVLLATLSLVGIAFVTMAPLMVAEASSNGTDGPGCPPE